VSNDIVRGGERVTLAPCCPPNLEVLDVDVQSGMSAEILAAGARTPLATTLISWRHFLTVSKHITRDSVSGRIHMFMCMCFVLCSFVLIFAVVLFSFEVGLVPCFHLFC
jgi:hypothetical protein